MIPKKRPYYDAGDMMLGSLAEYVKRYLPPGALFNRVQGADVLGEVTFFKAVDFESLTTFNAPTTFNADMALVGNFNIIGDVDVDGTLTSKKKIVIEETTLKGDTHFGDEGTDKFYIVGQLKPADSGVNSGKIIGVLNQTAGDKFSLANVGLNEKFYIKAGTTWEMYIYGNMTLEPLSEPSGIEGKIYYDSTEHIPKWCDDTLSWNTFGITKLSELEIDADKDWNGKSITNINTLIVSTTDTLTGDLVAGSFESNNIGIGISIGVGGKGIADSGQSAIGVRGWATVSADDPSNNATAGYFIIENNLVNGASTGVGVYTVGTQPATAGVNVIGTSPTRNFKFGYAISGNVDVGVDFTGAGVSPAVCTTGIDFTGATISGDAIEMAGFGINATSWSISGDGSVEFDTTDHVLVVDAANDRVGIGTSPSYPFEFTYTPTAGMSVGKYASASSALGSGDISILDMNTLIITGGTAGIVTGGWLDVSGLMPDAGVAVFGQIDNSIAGAPVWNFLATSVGTEASAVGYTFAGTSPFAGGVFTKGIDFGRVNNTFTTGIDFTGATITGNAIEMAGFGIVGLVDPTNPQDAATRAYVLSQISVESLDDAYDNGSAIAVDTTNVVWTLDDNKEFNIFESGGNNIFSVKALAAGDEVHIGDAINTPVNLELYGNLNMHSDITGVAKITRDSDNITIQTTTSGHIEITSADDIDLGAGAVIGIVGDTDVYIGAATGNVDVVATVGTLGLQSDTGITLETVASGNIELTPVGNVNITTNSLEMAGTPVIDTTRNLLNIGHFQGGGAGTHNIGESGDTIDLTVAGVTYTRPLQMVNFYYAGSADLNGYAVGDAGETDKGFKFNHAGSITKVHISARTGSGNTKTTTFTIKNETDPNSVTFTLNAGVTSENIDITDLPFDADDEISLQITALGGSGSNASDFNIVLHYTQTGA